MLRTRHSEENNDRSLSLSPPRRPTILPAADRDGRQRRRGRAVGRRERRVSGRARDGWRRVGRGGRGRHVADRAARREGNHPALVPRRAARPLPGLRPREDRPREHGPARRAPRAARRPPPDAARGPASVRVDAGIFFENARVVRPSAVARSGPVSSRPSCWRRRERRRPLVAYGGAVRTERSLLIYRSVPPPLLPPTAAAAATSAARSRRPSSTLGS